jgi:chromosomal replication initiation ATPase DnaA
VVGEQRLYQERGVFNEPRNAAMYLMMQLRDENLSEICREYGLQKHSSARSVAERGEKSGVEKTRIQKKS